MTTEKEPAITENASYDRKYKSYSVKEAREKYKEAYQPWTAELDQELSVMYSEGITVRDLVRHFGRTKGAIRSRIRKLELAEVYG